MLACIKPPCVSALLLSRGKGGSAVTGAQSIPKNQTKLATIRNDCVIEHVIGRKCQINCYDYSKKNGQFLLCYFIKNKY